MTSEIEGPPAEPEPEIPGWTGEVRADGAVVVGAVDGKNFIVVMPGRGAIVTCPCCGLLFNKAVYAKRICNAVYPLEGRHDA